MQTTPFFETNVILPCKEGVVGLKVFPHSLEVLWQSSEEDHCFSDLVPLSIPSSTLLLHQEEGTQLGKELGFHQVLQQLQNFNQARIQLECELGQEAQELAQRYDDHQIKLAMKHEKKVSKDDPREKCHL